MAVSVAGKPCGASAVTLAQPDAAGVLRTVTNIDHGSFFDPGLGYDVHTKELAPGTYHVVQYACRAPSAVAASSDSRFTGVLLTEAIAWESSFGHFTVAAGETVVAGQVNLEIAGLKVGPRGGVQARYKPVVTPFSQDQQQTAAKTFPAEIAKASARLLSPGLKNEGLLSVPGCDPARRPANAEEAKAWELLCARS